ncbi:hypothetical protein NLX83_04915 [Allokutzneria sp. A3M-2-11 16]|uniref:hypothetical protein n=1 Tax=Allokutzneria sp. A3M-2-11 16 TaxID=2962043 RepID=UPI0020B80811|nr:hypothetical protein [Allokutzneria sp. A3M-2-11 16]MCP3798594.1 hypothetical protein [Allokutzneria sp. A3M-2-11 16]
MTEPAAVAPAGDEPKKRRSPINKPDFDSWATGKKALTVLALLPVFAVVAFFAQFLELLYYLVMGVYYLVTSPYWICRAIYRASSSEDTPRRQEARASIATFFKVSGCLLAIVVVFGGGLFLLVTLINMGNE